MADVTVTLLLRDHMTGEDAVTVDRAGMTKASAAALLRQVAEELAPTPAPIILPYEPGPEGLGD